MDEALVVPLKRAAQLLSVSPRTLRRLVGAGVLSAVMLGGRQMIPTSELKRVTQPRQTREAPAGQARGTRGQQEVERLRALRQRRG
jgi:excisionase family DNA binding protein